MTSSSFLPIAHIFQDIYRLRLKTMVEIICMCRYLFRNNIMKHAFQFIERSVYFPYILFIHTFFFYLYT